MPGRAQYIYRGSKGLAAGSGGILISVKKAREKTQRHSKWLASLEEFYRAGQLAFFLSSSPFLDLNENLVKVTFKALQVGDPHPESITNLAQSVDLRRSKVHADRFASCPNLSSNNTSTPVPLAAPQRPSASYFLAYAYCRSPENLNMSVEAPRERPYLRRLCEVNWQVHTPVAFC